MSHIFSGHLEDEPSARVYGFMNEAGIFEGKIYTQNGTYYVERASRYLNDSDPAPKEMIGDHSVIYKSEDVKHPYLDTLGAGCGAGQQEESVRRWMEEISNSATEEDIDNEVSYRLPLPRAKRSPLDHSHLFDGIPTIPSYSFSNGNNNGRRDSGGLEDLFSRNPQSRISHDRKDFYPPTNVVPSSFPSSTVKRRACSLYIQTDTYLWDHIRKDSSSDIKVSSIIFILHLVTKSCICLGSRRDSFPGRSTH